MQPIKALIVDDELQSRNFLTKMLRQYFPEINIASQASTVEEGLQEIEKYHPGIVFRCVLPLHILFNKLF